LLLKVAATEEATRPRIAVGEYVPLAVEWDCGPHLPLYWRPGDHVRSLVEVGLHPGTGAICSIRVVLPGEDVEILDEGVPAVDLAATSGRPLFETDRWRGLRFLDVHLLFTLILRRDSVTLRFAPPGLHSSDLASGDVRFHLSGEGTVVGLSVVGLTGAQMQQVRATVEWLRGQGAPF
jgi:hypothetical protein